MMLPYTVEVYFVSMASYNATWFPVVVVGALLALAAVALALRPPAGREPAAARLIFAILAAAWLWVGAVHQLRLMATLNFLAPAYGVAWIAQGALFALYAALGRRTTFRFAGDAAGRIGLALALLGIAAYPLAVLALGHDWDGLPLAGTAPDPTAILTAGLLLAARPHPPLQLFVVPLGWAGIAAVSASLLPFPLDYSVAAAVIAAAGFAVRARLRPVIFSPDGVFGRK